MPLNPRAMAMEAGLTAFVVALLTIGMVGIDLVDVNTQLEIQSRLPDVIAAAIIAFVGRVVLIFLRERRFRFALYILAPVIAALAVLLIGRFVTSETTAQTLGDILPFHDPIVSWVIFFVAIGLAAKAITGMRQTGRVVDAESRGERIRTSIARSGRYLGPAFVIAAVALPFLPFADRQILDIGVLVLTYVMLGWGLNIVVGLAGLLDLGYVAFYGVGAYSYALLAQATGLGFWSCLPFAGVVAALCGVLLGFPVLRLRGDYLAIVTLGFGEMVRVILTNWTTFTNGPSGIGGIPKPTFFGLPVAATAPNDGPTFFSVFGLEYSPISRVIFLYYIILILALVTNLFTLRIRKLPIGRAWEALREDEVACASLGINPRNTKLTAFSIGAMFAGFAGSFFATRQGFVSPESFTFIESAVILAIVVLGGMGSQVGVVIAAIILIGLPELFRELHQYRMLAFGGAMILIMVWRPQGMLAHREPTLRLNSRTPEPGRS
ncbi:MAG TPA: high-affinity branched-chain amino acid ABC transporter permease LivM [Magnetospirillaceae bacterium]|jgi:branched-chain amino acid transport system permease protein